MIRHGRYGEFTACSRIPRLQIREAEFHRREVPGLQGWGSGREEGAQRATLSTDARTIRSASSLPPTSRSPKSARSCGHEFLVEKNLKDGPGDRVPQQGVRLQTRSPSTSSGSRGSRRFLKFETKDFVGGATGVPARRGCPPSIDINLDGRARKSLHRSILICL